MTNLEKYKDEIMNFDNDDLDFCDGFVKKRILLPFGHNECEQIGCERCAMLQMIWLQEEYKEPEELEVDWSKVPVDTPIYVRDHENNTWVRGHFAKYEDGQIYAWSYGHTSFTEIAMTKWRCAKLAKDNCNFKEEQE